MKVAVVPEGLQSLETVSFPSRESVGRTRHPRRIRLRDLARASFHRGAPCQGVELSPSAA
jgi:hypothetical protein